MLPSKNFRADLVKGRFSLQKCLMLLGVKNVYSLNKVKRKKVIRSCYGKAERSLWQKMEADDIYDLAKRHRKKFLTKFHPDKNKGCPECTKKCQEAEQAFNWIVQTIPRHHPNWRPV